VSGSKYDDDAVQGPNIGSQKVQFLVWDWARRRLLFPFFASISLLSALSSLFMVLWDMRTTTDKTTKRTMTEEDEKSIICHFWAEKANFEVFLND